MANGRQRVRGVAVALAVLAALALVSACGQPRFTYVANSDDKTYVRIPSSWHEVDQTVIDDYFGAENPDSAVGQIRKQLRWSAAYDASDSPMAEHMTSAMTSAEPVLYLTVRHLVPSEQGMISFDYLRDVFIPVTDNRRRLATQAGYDVSSFELLYDQLLPPGDNGLHGVRVVFNYQLPTGVVHTFDQTAYANADSSTLYLLLIRCTARCYRERMAEIDDIATSFTVRSKV